MSWRRQRQMRPRFSTASSSTSPLPVRRISINIPARTTGSSTATSMRWTATSWKTGRATTASRWRTSRRPTDVRKADVKAADGCPKGGIYAQRNGIVTRGILFDATLLPGKAGPQGWLEPGTAIHREDLEALEKIEHVSVSPGDVILLHTGRWKRRAALGAWKPSDGYAGYHA